MSAVRVRLSPTCDPSRWNRTHYGCQRFESAYLQPVIQVDGIAHTSMEELWKNLDLPDEVQTTKGLRWIPRHSEMKKGVVNDEMLRGAENKYRSEDSRIG
ncbi:hypothetical protein KP509_01G056000 [Ceratopteris richardii]|uniref:Uncharacterized protein n=1 Tax=Ceratopteris richardii TaxID=49495 RepID=A0A8T2VLJ4_CERRI|nr:hypothetical protein KP509_01G056000 [Ceratopteris richardii]